MKVCKAVQDIKEEGREEGITIGEARGREAGEMCFSRLVLKLEENHREAEIVKVAKDKEYREQLYKEYQLL